MLQRLALALFPLLAVSLSWGQNLDPRCSTRTAMGRFTCVINKPDVRHKLTPYNQVVFAPGDQVMINAGGCVQTGGVGRTWKRYVDPKPASDKRYFGTIRIPSGTTGASPHPIQDVIGQTLTVTGAGVPASELILYLGYVDDNYDDNGYDDHDDGTDDQCKGVGPARVFITISRTGSPVPTPTPSDKFNFNLEWSAVDQGGFPINPQWTFQRKNPGQVPDTSLCHNFSKQVFVEGIPVLVPDFADCTDQTDLSHVDTPDGFNADICSFQDSNGFHGHVNWFTVTFDGKATWGDHNADDDYYIALENPGAPAQVNNRTALHTEFDSDETIDNFQSSWWIDFHWAVDHDRAAGTLRGQHTIMTGLFGLDCEHNCKSELHPVYAMAANIREDDQDDLWAMFVRNAGDEGFCSQQIWEAPFTTYTFHLPWRFGMTSIEVLQGPGETQFAGTNGTSGPEVTYTPGKGVDVTFTLPPPSQTPLMDGALHLRWISSPVVSGGNRLPAIPGGALATEPRVPSRTGPAIPTRSVGRETDDDSEKMIRAAIEKLSAAEQQKVHMARALAQTHPALHLLPAIAPARQVTALRPARQVAVRLGSKGPVAVRKLQRDAAQMRALCAAHHNAPPGLPPNICQKVR